jgi:hypothetical protein
MRYLLPGLVALSMLTLLPACKKEPGEGGRAEIRGRVKEQRYSRNTGQPVGPVYLLPEQRVYIIYGDGTYHDDDVRTGPDGTFRFPWLQKGDYTVYTISECGQYNGCTYAVQVRTSIGSRKEVVDIGDLLIENW